MNTALASNTYWAGKLRAYLQCIRGITVADRVTGYIDFFHRDDGRRDATDDQKQRDRVIVQIMTSITGRGIRSLSGARI
jgi:hypothetical protein